MKQRTYLYPIKIESCKEGGFLASCPSIQGCYAEGDTIDGAVGNLKDVIKVVLEYKNRNKKTTWMDSVVSLEDKYRVRGLNLAIPR